MFIHVYFIVYIFVCLIYYDNVLFIIYIYLYAFYTFLFQHFWSSLVKKVIVFIVFF